MTATHKFPMPTVSFGLTTSDKHSLEGPQERIAPHFSVQPNYFPVQK